MPMWFDFLLIAAPEFIQQGTFIKSCDILKIRGETAFFFSAVSNVKQTNSETSRLKAANTVIADKVWEEVKCSKTSLFFCKHKRPYS